MADILTVEEARQRLSIVNAAIDDCIRGTRRKSLKIGTHEFMRAYEFETLTYAELVTERDNLLAYINANATTPITPKFRQYTNFPLIVTNVPE